MRNVEAQALLDSANGVKDRLQRETIPASGASPSF